MKRIVFFIAIFHSHSVFSQAGFAPVKSDKYAESIEVTNVPPVMSQDSLGVCFAYTSSTLLTAENCRYSNTDCAKISEDELFSPLALSAYGAFKYDEYSNMTAVPAFDGGAASSNVLNVVIERGSAPAESCVSLDKILDKVGGSKELATEAQVKIWENMKTQYAAYKAQEENCPKCASEIYATAKSQINENFELKKSEAELLKAFASDSYNEFLKMLLIPKECARLTKSVILEGSVQVGNYPELQSNKKGTYKEAIKQVKKVLTDKRPLGVSLCLDEKIPKNTKSCENSHSVVITGYRRVCKLPNSCRDVVKVLNSWGKSWQDGLGTDSWIDAKALLDRSTYSEGSLTWLEDKPKKAE